MSTEQLATTLKIISGSQLLARAREIGPTLSEFVDQDEVNRDQAALDFLNLLIDGDRPAAWVRVTKKDFYRDFDQFEEDCGIRFEDATITFGRYSRDPINEGKAYEGKVYTGPGKAATYILVMRNTTKGWQVSHIYCLPNPSN